MGVLVFNLRHVPDDEAEEVRALLDDHDIEFYETSAGIWGIGVAAIWLYDKTQLVRAKALIKAYEEKRQEAASSTYREAVASRQQLTFWQILWCHPVQTVAYVVALIVILYFSLAPFIFFSP